MGPGGEERQSAASPPLPGHSMPCNMPAMHAGQDNGGMAVGRPSVKEMTGAWRGLRCIRHTPLPVSQTPSITFRVQRGDVLPSSRFLSPPVPLYLFSLSSLSPLFSPQCSAPPFSSLPFSFLSSCPSSSPSLLLLALPLLLPLFPLLILLSPSLLHLKQLQQPNVKGQRGGEEQVEGCWWWGFSGKWLAVSLMRQV